MFSAKSIPVVLLLFALFASRGGSGSEAAELPPSVAVAAGAAAAASGRPSFASLTLELDLGASYGLSPRTVDQSAAAGGVSPATAASVVRGAASQQPDSLYFKGLLHLYGHGGMPEDHEKGLASIREAAELGHLEAQTALGMLLLNGVGGGSSSSSSSRVAAAVAWLRKAAKAGHKDAQWIVGKHLLEAEQQRLAALGTAPQPARFAEAIAHLRAAAAQDSREAFFHLAQLHEYGAGGVAQDHAHARLLYRRAAQRGFLVASYHLALMVAFGRGGPQDFREAFALLQDAAQQGHAPSLYYCGVFHLFGHGVPVDYHQALRCFDTAAQLQDPHVSAQAAAARDELTASLRKAKEVNGELAERYAALEHASDRGLGGVGGGQVVDADDADAEVEAAMAQATADAARPRPLDRDEDRDAATRSQPLAAAVAGAVEEQVKRTSGTL